MHNSEIGSFSSNSSTNIPVRFGKWFYYPNQQKEHLKLTCAQVDLTQAHRAGQVKIEFGTLVLKDL